MLHRPHIVYLLSHDVSIDMLEYVVHLIEHVHTLPYQITIVTQATKVDN